MSSKQTGSDVNLAYPMAEIAVMGAQGAINILYRNADDDRKAKELEEYAANFANPYQAAEKGYIDEIILPRQTRFKLIQALEMTQSKLRTNPHKSTATCHCSCPKPNERENRPPRQNTFGNT